MAQKMVMEQSVQEQEKETQHFQVCRPLPLVLSEALTLERQLAQISDVEERQRLETLYENVVTEAITGGYDPLSGKTNGYADRDSSSIDPKTVDYYRDFVNGNGKSRTAELAEEYIRVLEEQGFEINETVEAYYKSFPEKVSADSRVTDGFWSWFRHSFLLSM